MAGVAGTTVQPTPYNEGDGSTTGVDVHAVPQADTDGAGVTQTIRGGTGMKIEVGKKFIVKEHNGIYAKGEIFKIEGIADEGRTILLRFLDDKGGKISEDYRVLKNLSLGEIVDKPTKPAHYDTAIDTIAFAKANFSREAVQGFMRINAIKYLQRAGKKGEKLSDLRKTRSYIDMMIEMEEEK